MSEKPQASTIKGPAIFLAQGYGKPGWSTLAECAKTAGSLGYKGMQVQLWKGGPIDLNNAATSAEYCQEQQGIATEAGCPIVELANHCDTQLVVCGQAYFPLHKGLAPEALRGSPSDVAEWALGRAKKSASAARNFGFDTVAAFSGTSIFHTVYPWPQRPAGLVEAAMNHLASSWMPAFDHAKELGVKYCFELHPGEDLMDGTTFEMFLQYVKDHVACCILLDLSHFALAAMAKKAMLAYIKKFKDRIKMMHVKDGEFFSNENGGVYGGYLPWHKRQGRFRSLGDGQIDYQAVFDLVGRELGLDLCSTVEWEDCAGKGWKQGVREGVDYVNAWTNQTQEPQQTSAEAHEDGAFDDFAATDCDAVLIGELLGIPTQDVNVHAPK
jgi:sugar phosphate isomerase/epimerase